MSRGFSSGSKIGGAETSVCALYPSLALSVSLGKLLVAPLFLSSSHSCSGEQKKEERVRIVVGASISFSSDSRLMNVVLVAKDYSDEKILNLRSGLL